MSFSKIFGALALASFLVGCAGSPLSEAQKAEFKAMNANVSSVLSKSKDRRAVPMLSALGATTAPTELETKLVTKFNSGDCTIDEPAAGSSGNMKFKIGGAKCGFTADVDVTQKGASSTDDVDAQFKIFFEITDPELLALSDVSKYDLSGYFKLNLKDKSSASIDAKMTGAIISKKHGKVDMTFSASGNLSNGVKMSARYNCKSFDVRVEVVISESKSEIKLNDKVVTAKELNDVLGDGGVIPGASQTKVEDNSSGSSSIVLFE